MRSGGSRQKCPINLGMPKCWLLIELIPLPPINSATIFSRPRSVHNMIFTIRPNPQSRYPVLHKGAFGGTGFFPFVQKIDHAQINLSDIFLIVFF